MSEERSLGLSGAKWTALVIVIGAILGLAFTLVPLPREFRREEFRILNLIDTVVATVVLALAVALVYLYARTHSETRAPFALGLLFVLSAFLLHTVFTHPIFYAAFGTLSFGVVFVLPVHAFEAATLAIFLYLSLE